MSSSTYVCLRVCVLVCMFKGVSVQVRRVMWLTLEFAVQHYDLM